jgi:Tol biopolymer transport system component
VGVDPQDPGYPLWVVRADGSGLHKVAERALSPAWSPNSRKIAFVKPAGQGNGYSTYPARLLIADADGTHSIDVAPTAVPRFAFAAPAWSPRGDWIAYEGPGLRLELIRPDGSGHRILRRNVGADASWAPTGDRVVFDYFNELPERSAFGIVDLWGRRLKSLERGGYFVPFAPTWSPRSPWIAYVDGEPKDPNHQQLFMIRSDGTGRRQVTDDLPLSDIVIADNIVRLAWLTRGPSASRSLYYFRNYCTDPTD